MKRRRRDWIVVAGIGLASSLLFLGLQWAGWLTGYELRSVDLMMVLRGPAPVDPRVVILDIDSASVDHYGQWPWPRPVLARLVNRLSDAQARVIAFDVVFAEPSRAGDQDDAVFAEAIRKAGNVILGYYFRSAPRGDDPRSRGYYGGDPFNILDSAVEQAIDPAGGLAIPERAAVEPNIDLLAEAADSQGYFSIDPDPDGVVRHYAAVAKNQDIYYPALAVRAVQRAVDAGPLTLEPYQGRLPRLILAERPIPVDESGQLWINYRGPAGSFESISAVDVIEGRIDPGQLKDRIVFIGASEIGIADLRATPLANVVPGVEIHATVADNLLNHRYIHDTALHLAISMMALLILGPLTGLVVLRLPHSPAGFALAATPVFGWLVICWIAFAHFNTHLQVIAPFFAAALGYVGATVYETVFVEARARQIKKTFQQFVSSAVVEEMLKDPEKVKLGGERRDMTVLFSDIRGFTTISEQMDPETAVRVLNEFLTPMTRIVIEHGGTLDKYMGDAIMAFFGAPIVQPDHAARACRATLTMRDELDRLNAGWLATGFLPVPLHIGIGLNSGEMSVGNMGSLAVFDYTVIGDNVNLGSRIEGLNKLYGSEILVSEATAKAAGDGFVFRELDRVRVKGKHLPVDLYELICLAPAAAETTGWLNAFAQALAAYRSRDFLTAEQTLVTLLEQHPSDGAASLYLERCRTLVALPPPDDWDGVENLTSK